MLTDSVQYGGFWRRLGAILLDIVIMTPLMVPIWWGQLHFRLFDIYWFVPSQVFALFYFVYLVKKFGGTPGKLLVGLRIRKLNLERVGYREAFVRNLPEFLLGLIASIATMIALTHISDADYFSLTLKSRLKHLRELEPHWSVFLHIVQQIWIWSELVVLLTNRKRRALHDFIAGTVVVVDLPKAAPQLTTIPQPVA